MPPHEPLIVQLGELLLLVTPIATVLWLILRRSRAPQASLAPGWTALGVWCLLALATGVMMMLAMGGHSGIVGEIFIGVGGAICAGILWLLYGKLGVGRRDITNEVRN